MAQFFNFLTISSLERLSLPPRFGLVLCGCLPPLQGPPQKRTSDARLAVSHPAPVALVKTAFLSLSFSGTSFSIKYALSNQVLRGMTCGIYNGCILAHSFRRQQLKEEKELSEAETSLGEIRTPSQARPGPPPTPTPDCVF